MKKIQRIIRNTFLVFKTFQERKTFKILQNWFKKKTDHDINKIIIVYFEKMKRLKKLIQNGRNNRKNRQKLLFYIGAHRGGSLSSLINKYRKIYCFEANPDLIEVLRKRFSNYKNVNIIHAAVCDIHNSVIELNISANNGASSSILKPNPGNSLKDVIKTIKTVTVPTINLFNFCKENKIKFIDTYISDLQGIDFIVLNTLKEFIDTKKIGRIQCETEKDDSTPIYIGSEGNREKNYSKLLDANYIKISEGWGLLKDNIFTEVPNDWDEKDVCWILKK